MPQRIVIAGGYGVVGAATARLIRAESAETEIVLAGRQPHAGDELARQLGQARTARLDLADAATFAALAGADLVIAALHDSADILLEAAIAQGAGHIGVTKLSDSIAPAMFAALARKPARPIAPFGHWMAGAPLLAAAATLAQFRTVDSIDAIALYDPADMLGPMSAGDADSLMGRALMRTNGAWIWSDAMNGARQRILPDGQEVTSIPMALLDVPSLAAISGARDIRFDLAQGVSHGTRARLRASHDVHVEIVGALKGGARVRRRLFISDPEGMGRMTALGIAVAAVRMLGLDGAPAPAGGFYTPETLLSPHAACARLRAAGVAIEEHDSGA